MRFEILQENLISGLNIVSRIVPSRPQIPVLGNVLVEAQNGGLDLTGGNGEITIKTRVGAKISADGAICLPARTFVELVSSLTGKIEFSVSGHVLEIKSGNFTGKITGLGPDEYPKLEATEKRDPTISFPARDLSQALGRVIFVTAIDESRPALTGVLWKPTKAGVKFVGTDAFRLSLVELAVTHGDFSDIIVPSLVLHEVSRLLGMVKVEKVAVFLQESEVVFDLGETIVESRLIAAAYPNFEKIIPSGQTLKLTVSPGPFLTALKTAAIFARDNSNIIRLKIAGGTGEIKLVAAAPSVGEQEQVLEGMVDGKVDEDFTIAFNFRYLLDLLSALGGEELAIGFSGPLAPATFTFANEPGFLHIIMPVRVQN